MRGKETREEAKGEEIRGDRSRKEAKGKRRE